jgi:hypothetical protein
MNITLTGIDELTDFGDIRALLTRGAELGILYTETPEGRHRYPSIKWMVELFRAVPGRYALHVCGRAARAHLLAGDRPMLTMPVQRIQINGIVGDDEIYHACTLFRDWKIITQSHSGNSVNIGCENHQVLVDGSGGRGISPGVWVRPTTPRDVGFAGGLGPHNLADQLPRISDMACDPWWVDMEGRLRDSQDWFSSAAALAALDVFDTHTAQPGRSSDVPENHS